MGIAILDTGMNYVHIGLTFIRNILTKIAGVLPWDSGITLTILFLLFSIWVSFIIVKRFVIRPFSINYLPYTLLIAISLFLNLMYL